MDYEEKIKQLLENFDFTSFFGCTFFDFFLDFFWISDPLCHIFQKIRQIIYYIFPPGDFFLLQCSNSSLECLEAGPPGQTAPATIIIHSICICSTLSVHFRLRRPTLPNPPLLFTTVAGAARRYYLSALAATLKFRDKYLL